MSLYDTTIVQDVSRAVGQSLVELELMFTLPSDNCHQTGLSTVMQGNMPPPSMSPTTCTQSSFSSSSSSTAADTLPLFQKRSGRDLCSSFSTTDPLPVSSAKIVFESWDDAPAFVHVKHTSPRFNSTFTSHSTSAASAPQKESRNPKKPMVLDLLRHEALTSLTIWDRYRGGKRPNFDVVLTTTPTVTTSSSSSTTTVDMPRQPYSISNDHDEHYYTPLEDFEDDPPRLPARVSATRPLDPIHFPLLRLPPNVTFLDLDGMIAAKFNFLWLQGCPLLQELYLSGPVLRLGEQRSGPVMILDGKPSRGNASVRLACSRHHSHHYPLVSMRQTVGDGRRDSEEGRQSRDSSHEHPRRQIVRFIDSHYRRHVLRWKWRASRRNQIKHSSSGSRDSDHEEHDFGTNNYKDEDSDISLPFMKRMVLRGTPSLQFRFAILRCMPHLQVLSVDHLHPAACRECLTDENGKMVESASDRALLMSDLTEVSLCLPLNLGDEEGDDDDERQLGGYKETIWKMLRLYMPNVEVLYLAGETLKAEDVLEALSLATTPCSGPSQHSHTRHKSLFQRGFQRLKGCLFKSCAKKQGLFSSKTAIYSTAAPTLSVSSNSWATASAANDGLHRPLSQLQQVRISGLGLPNQDYIDRLGLVPLPVLSDMEGYDSHDASHRVEEEKVDTATRLINESLMKIAESVMIKTKATRKHGSVTVEHRLYEINGVHYASIKR